MSTIPVRIDKETVSRLKIHKKKYKSYDSVISAFCDYFDATGVSPSEIQTSPISIVKKRSDDIVKVIRGIEKKQLPILNRIEGLVEMIYNQKKHLNDGNLEGEISIEEQLILVQKIEELESKIEGKNNEISSLKKRVLDGQNTPPEQLKNDQEIPVNHIKKQLRNLIDNKEVSKIKRTHYQVEKNVFDSSIQSIYNLIK